MKEQSKDKHSNQGGEDSKVSNGDEDNKASNGAEDKQEANITQLRSEQEVDNNNELDSFRKEMRKERQQIGMIGAYHARINMKKGVKKKQKIFESPFKGKI